MKENQINTELLLNEDLLMSQTLKDLEGAKITPQVMN